MPLPFASLDADDLFAYKTSRRIVIRDRKLGLIRLGIIIAIFVYVVIYEVVLRKGYLKKQDPVGFVRTSVRVGEVQAGLPYCCSYTGCSEPAFGGESGRLRCLDWDRHGIVHPPGEEFSVFVSTRVTVTDYAPVPRSCWLNESGSGCPPWRESTQRSYFVSSPETLSVMITHGVNGRGGGTVVSASEMVGAVLKGADGEAGTALNFCGSTTPGVAHTNMGSSCTEADRERPGDILTLGQLMAAAGLKDGLDVRPKSSAGTYRYDGIVVLLFVEYTGTGIDTSMSYEYEAVHVPASEYKYEEVHYVHQGDSVSRQVWNRHGVRVILIQSGYVAVFDFAELMKTLVIGLSLSKIAEFLVDAVFINALPLGWVYKRYRDIKTRDFSEVANFATEVTDDDYLYGENHVPGWRKAAAGPAPPGEGEMQQLGSSPSPATGGGPASSPA
eukprot:TRINITY_DN18434_c0_g2_i2.p1 TRINITY_DN18434_c0_g2~~TRINITY_DN18434_c0_g2_i2.p1  ORF type:complete len:470 (+),score=126.57 TRINITY_DN18434_c0_g2_i2:85-1410(+)